MCGIFAYTGSNGKNAGTLLLDGLVSLEYRGYDSAGIFTPEGGLVRAPGAVAELTKKIPADYTGQSGIAHLRWATHGAPLEKNAHPHRGMNGDIWLVHNGIIENFEELKTELATLGHTFTSDTDTEVLAHLVEEEIKKANSFEKGVFAALHRIRGTYGLAIQKKSEPEKLMAARMGSPIVLGVGESERFIASDPSPILPHTRRVIFLEDGEVAMLTPDSHEICKLDGTRVEREPVAIEWSAEQAQKGGYEHFMLKEIMEEPEAVRNTCRGRLEGSAVKIEGLEAIEEKLKKVQRIVLVACGTAAYAAQAGEYLLESEAGIPVDAEIASEFRYRRPVIAPDTAVIAISQSGETLDTLEAMREGKRQGAITLALVNTVGSTIAREADARVYLNAGPEISVASTKAYISQLTSLALLTSYLTSLRGEASESLTSELADLPEKIQNVLSRSQSIKAVAEKYAAYEDFLFIGRKFNYATAFEGALKLKETSYIHAEACGAGEMKHGHIAMIDKDFPTFAIASNDSVYEKMISNIQEIKARSGPVIVVATEGNTDIARLVDDVIYVPKTLEALSPILNVVPLHLFAYYFATTRGCNVDRPRNLAKSVTVE